MNLMCRLLAGVNPQLVMFDLDGTLVDSAPDLFFCVNDMLKRLGRAPVVESDVRLWIGNGVKLLVHRALTGKMEGRVNNEQLAQASTLFFEVYETHYAEHSIVFPGVIETLQQLKQQNIKLACVTNKIARFTEPLLTALRVNEYFDVVVSGDSCAELKPHPEPLYYAVKHCGVSVGECLFVGDSSNDVKAARAANIPVVAVSYGYNHGQDVRDSHPDAVIDSLLQLCN